MVCDKAAAIIKDQHTSRFFSPTCMSQAVMNVTSPLILVYLDELPGMLMKHCRAPPQVFPGT